MGRCVFMKKLFLLVCFFWLLFVHTFQKSSKREFSHPQSLWLWNGGWKCIHIVKSTAKAKTKRKKLSLRIFTCPPPSSLFLYLAFLFTTDKALVNPLFANTISRISWNRVTTYTRKPFEWGRASDNGNNTKKTNYFHFAFFHNVSCHRFFSGMNLC